MDQKFPYRLINRNIRWADKGADIWMTKDRAEIENKRLKVWGQCKDDESKQRLEYVLDPDRELAKLSEEKSPAESGYNYPT